MFCREPILAAYEGEPEYDSNEDAFLDCYHDLAYHCTPGCRIVLETEHFYISLGTDGAVLREKNCTIEELQKPGECLCAYIHPPMNKAGLPWVEYESTLFVDQRLLRVENAKTGWLLTFDDFALKLIPHSADADDVPSLYNKDHFSYHHVYGCERLLRKRCACGGSGELFLDFVQDYVVRCSRCKKSTWASMCAIEAIKNWNDGELHWDASNIVIE